MYGQLKSDLNPLHSGKDLKGFSQSLLVQFSSLWLKLWLFRGYGSKSSEIWTRLGSFYTVVRLIKLGGKFFQLSLDDLFCSLRFFQLVRYKKGVSNSFKLLHYSWTLTHRRIKLFNSTNMKRTPAYSFPHRIHKTILIR